MIHSVDFHPKRGAGVLAAGINGAFISSDLGNNWDAFGRYEILHFSAHGAVFDDSDFDRYLVSIEAHGINAFAPSPNVKAALNSTTTTTGKVTISNPSSDTAHAVVVTVTFDPVLTGTQASLPGGTCTTTGNVASCTLPQLGAIQSVTLDLAAQSGGTGNPGVAVSVASADVDKDLADNSISWRVNAPPISSGGGSSGGGAASGGGATGFEGLLLLSLLALARRRRADRC